MALDDFSVCAEAADLQNQLIAWDQRTDYSVRGDLRDAWLPGGLIQRRAPGHLGCSVNHAAIVRKQCA